MDSRFSRKFLVLGTVVVLGAAGTAAAFLVRGHREVTTSSAEAYEYYLKARDAERKLYSREAIEAYAQALARDPAFPMATLGLAGQLSGRDPARAHSLVEAALRRIGDVSERERLLMRIVEAEHLKNDPSSVDRLIEAFVQRYPADPEGRLLLAKTRSRQGKLDEARVEYEKIIELDPNFAMAYNSLGYHWMRQRDFVKAEDFLRRYRFLAPEQANPYDSLGELYANTGRYDEADAVLRKGLEIRPDFAPSVAHLGTVRVGRGDPLGAAEQFRRAAEMADEIYTKLAFGHALATCLLDAGRGEDALAEYDRIPALPTSTLVGPAKGHAAVERKLLRSVFLGGAGRLEEAGAELNGAKDALRESGKVEKHRLEELVDAFPRAEGWLAYRRGEYSEALALLLPHLPKLDAGAGGFPYYPIAQRCRIVAAECAVAAGKPEEARKLLDEILAINPLFQPAVAARARLLGAEKTSP